MILDTLSAAQVCAALEHFVDRLRGVAIDARLATGFVWGAILGMMAAGVLYLKLNGRHRSQFKQVMRTMMETSQELQKTSSLYSLQCQRSQVGSSLPEYGVFSDRLAPQELQHKLRRMEENVEGSAKHCQNTTDAAYQTLRRGGERSNRLVAEHERTILALTEEVTRMKVYLSRFCPRPRRTDTHWGLAEKRRAIDGNRQ